MLRLWSVLDDCQGVPVKGGREARRVASATLACPLIAACFWQCPVLPRIAVCQYVLDEFASVVWRWNARRMSQAWHLTRKR